MKESVQQKVQALINKAAKSKATSQPSSTTSRNGSSLHQIIKTKQQAERFMKALQTA